jgi:hypothetical protein
MGTVTQDSLNGQSRSAESYRHDDAGARDRDVCGAGAGGDRGRRYDHRQARRVDPRRRGANARSRRSRTAQPARAVVRSEVDADPSYDITEQLLGVAVSMWTSAAVASARATSSMTVQRLRGSPFSSSMGALTTAGRRPQRLVRIAAAGISPLCSQGRERRRLRMRGRRRRLRAPGSARARVRASSRARRACFSSPSPPSVRFPAMWPCGPSPVRRAIYSGCRGRANRISGQRVRRVTAADLGRPER